MIEELKTLVEERMILGFLSSRTKSSYGPFDFSSLERKEIYPQKKLDTVNLSFCRGYYNY